MCDMKKLTSIVIFGVVGMLSCFNGLAQVSKDKVFDKTYYRTYPELFNISKYGVIFAFL